MRIPMTPSQRLVLVDELTGGRQDRAAMLLSILNAWASADEEQAAAVAAARQELASKQPDAIELRAEASNEVNWPGVAGVREYGTQGTPINNVPSQQQINRRILEQSEGTDNPPIPTSQD